MGDIEYNVEDVGGQLQAVVKIKLPSGTQAFAGVTANGTDAVSRKKAMANAAEQAIAGITPEYQAKLPEVEAHKAARAAEWEMRKASMPDGGAAVGEKEPPAKKAKK